MWVGVCFGVGIGTKIGTMMETRMGEKIGTRRSCSRGREAVVGTSAMRDPCLVGASISAIGDRVHSGGCWIAAAVRLWALFVGW
jgi:hypothetical protein